MTTGLKVSLLIVLATTSFLSAREKGNSLLLPFPKEAAAPVSSEQSTITKPGSTQAADAKLARELASSLIKRTNKSNKETPTIPSALPHRAELISLSSLPTPPMPSTDTEKQRTEAPRASLLTSIPAPKDIPVAEPELSDFAKIEDLHGLIGPLPELPSDEDSSPSSGLLPSPSSIPPSIQDVIPSKDPMTSVAREELSRAPSAGDAAQQSRRGPIFRISGVDAFGVARSRGLKFSPAGGIGSRDGIHTAAAQFPNFLTSEVHGPRMAQIRPPVTWAMDKTSNTFFMFCDATYNAVRLTEGWKIRGIQIQGGNWEWVACPRSGATTASFSVRIHAFKNPATSDSVVHFAGLTLEGPEGATDWRAAFPYLNGGGPSRTTPAQPIQPSLPPLLGSPDEDQPLLPKPFVASRGVE